MTIKDVPMKSIRELFDVLEDLRVKDVGDMAKFIIE